MHRNPPAEFVPRNVHTRLAYLWNNMLGYCWRCLTTVRPCILNHTCNNTVTTLQAYLSLMYWCIVYINHTANTNPTILQPYCNLNHTATILQLHFNYTSTMPKPYLNHTATMLLNTPQPCFLTHHQPHRTLETNRQQYRIFVFVLKIKVRRKPFDHTATIPQPYFKPTLTVHLPATIPYPYFKHTLNPQPYPQPHPPRLFYVVHRTSGFVHFFP